MKKKLLIFFIFLFFKSSFAQIAFQTFPKFDDCLEVEGDKQEKCFYDTLEKYVFKELEQGNLINDASYGKEIIAFFEVDTIGYFKVLYVHNAPDDLKKKVIHAFDKMPKILPATYSGKAVFSSFTLKIRPEKSLRKEEKLSENLKEEKEEAHNVFKEKRSKEYDLLESSYVLYDDPELESGLSIPFSHQNYFLFEKDLNLVGINNHTAVKPYSYEEVSKYFQFDDYKKSILKNKKSWWGRKFWNEHLVAIKGEGYWFSFDPILDLRAGKDFESELSNTFVNTRGIRIQGGLGDNLTFFSTIYESQGRFADYYNAYAESIKPSGGNPAIVPGVGIAKRFKIDAYDFPLAEAQLKYKANKFIDLQLGYGRNFIGDGYRSLLHGDAASPYPYFKINSTFWKIKYTNTYMWLKDVRTDVTLDGAYATKYMASHYLSYNLSKKMNLGLFESVVWSNTNDRGFDVNFVNPIIFYRAVEFSSSSKAGNAVLGASLKYKWTDNLQFYGQFLLDEFAIGDVKAANKSWRNKFGYQLGMKYFDLFSVPNLMLQMEYNHIRPYVYSHSNPLTNYGHNNQSMGHSWGANFREVVGIVRYQKGRIFAECKGIYGIKGLDFNTSTNVFNYGGNIYLNYDDNRPFDTGVKIAQGNKVMVLIAEAQIDYLLNPSSNLKLFGHLLFRDFSPEVETQEVLKNSTLWMSVGIKADLFNWYYDY